METSGTRVASESAALLVLCQLVLCGGCGDCLERQGKKEPQHRRKERDQICDRLTGIQVAPRYDKEATGS